MLHAFTAWAQEWQLEISIDKTQIYTIQLSAPHLLINNRELDIVLQDRDLGILVSDSLSPTDTVSKVHRRAKLIMRTFTSQDIELAYTYMVLRSLCETTSLVEHDSIVWSPYTIKNVETVERSASVQQDAQLSQKPRCRVRYSFGQEVED